MFLLFQEILLVLDGTTGLNMLPQAREFNEVRCLPSYFPWLQQLIVLYLHNWLLSCFLSFIQGSTWCFTWSSNEHLLSIPSSYDYLRLFLAHIYHADPLPIFFSTLPPFQVKQLDVSAAFYSCRSLLAMVISLLGFDQLSMVLVL